MNLPQACHNSFDPRLKAFRPISTRNWLVFRSNLLSVRRSCRYAVPSRVPHQPREFFDWFKVGFDLTVFISDSSQRTSSVRPLNSGQWRKSLCDHHILPKAVHSELSQPVRPNHQGRSNIRLTSSPIDMIHTTRNHSDRVRHTSSSSIRKVLSHSFYALRFRKGLHTQTLTKIVAGLELTTRFCVT